VTSLDAYRAQAKEALQAMVRRTGYEIHRCNPTHEEARLAKLLASQGVSVVLDVGANLGQYAQALRRGGYKKRIVSFEPLSGVFLELSKLAEDDPQWECRRLALGRAQGSADMNVSPNSDVSSFLQMNERYLRNEPTAAFIATEQVPVTRLDSIWDEVVRPEDRPYLKLDAQGFEMEILRGSEAALTRLTGVQAELSLAPLYEGAPLYREVIEHLASHGFRLAGFEPVWEDPETGEMVQIDGIFIRR
jgi:FkbM family methyltransferase